MEQSLAPDDDTRLWNAYSRAEAEHTRSNNLKPK